MDFENKALCLWACFFKTRPTTNCQCKFKATLHLFLNYSSKSDLRIKDLGIVNNMNWTLTKAMGYPSQKATSDYFNKHYYIKILAIPARPKPYDAVS